MPASAGDTRDTGSILILELGRSPGEINGNLPGKLHGQCNLAGYSQWGHKESDMTKHVHTHTKVKYHYFTSILVFPTLLKTEAQRGQTRFHI